MIVTLSIVETCRKTAFWSRDDSDKRDHRGFSTRCGGGKPEILVRTFETDAYISTC